jgi:glyoxylase-like metal-dependent hydrolase (beta-lactamase superfamily II)
VNGNAALLKRTGAKLAAFGRGDVPLADGDTLEIGSLRIEVRHVPGHADDHVLFWLPEQRVALTGDLLFVGKIGGTGTEEAARTEYESLQRVLAELPDDTTIWPGHDYGCRPASTIALEKLVNPFLQAPDFAAFLQLKRDWAAFKAEHGLK